MTEENHKKRDLSTSFALYVHLPFCRKRCAYCDFVSFTGKEGMISSYISHVLEEWKAILVGLVQPGPFEITSCYLGGGTPTLLSEDQIEILVQGLFPEGVNPSMEFTIEANPESLTVSKLESYRALGINRLSIGVQSFSDEILRRLGRVHTAEQAVNSINMIQETGWDNYSIDLMYGLPDQPVDYFELDLTRALSFNIPHMSAYSLKVNPKTPFGRLASKGKLLLPAEEKILGMMNVLEAKTAKAGYEHYETSNFAKPGFACKHNLTYWHLAPYIGIGLGAISYFAKECGPWGAHWENPLTFQEYEASSREHRWPFLDRKPLSREEAFMEALLTGLRLKEGIGVKDLKSRFGERIVGTALRRVPLLAEGGWLELKGGVLRATRKGARILDTLILELVSNIG